MKEQGEIKEEKADYFGVQNRTKVGQINGRTNDNPEEIRPSFAFLIQCFILSPFVSYTEVHFADLLRFVTFFSNFQRDHFT